MRLLRSAALFALCTTAVACGEIDDTTAPEETTVSKSVELTDPSGESRVTVIVSAASMDALSDIDLDSLVLNTGAQSLEGFVAEAGAEAEEDEGALRPLATVEVVDEQLADGINALSISETSAPTWRAPFMWRYQYSTKDCTDVTRTSFWHRVWVSVWSKETSSSGWSSMVSERKLSNRETLSRCDDNSYKLKVGVEARKRAHYSVEFND